MYAKELEEQKQKFTQEKDIIKDQQLRSSTKIKLDVGGKIFSTSLTTLTSQPNSMLAAMFSGRHVLQKDDDGSIFIDRSGDLFGFILEWLRNPHLPPSFKSNDEKLRVIQEAHYFQLDNLLELLGARIHKKQNPWTYFYGFGSRGSNQSQFRSPSGISINSKDQIYVCEYNSHRVQVFDKSSSHLFMFGTKGSDDGLFLYPVGIAIDNEDTVYVTDQTNHRIQVFDPKGGFIRKWGKLGTGDGEFKDPSGITIDSSNIVYVCEYQNHRVQIFKRNGDFIRKFGSEGKGDGKFNQPSGIAVDNEENEIYVCDTNNNRIQVFSIDGTFVRKFGTEGTENGQFKCPTGIIEKDGDIYVSDKSGRIQIFSKSGTFLQSFGTQGSANGQFISPDSMSFNSSGNILVTDLGSHRVQAFYNN